MKKVILLILVSVFVANTASAQFKFGVKVAFNASQVSNMLDGMTATLSNEFDAANFSVQNKGIRSAFAAGVFAEYSLCKKFAVSADLLYSQQGNWPSTYGRIQNPEPNSGGYVSAEFANRTDYLIVPLLANYEIVRGLAVKAGIQPGFLLSSKCTSTISTSHEYVRSVIDWKKEKVINTFDFSLPVGLSYTFRCGLLFDARYAFGMTKVNKQKYDKDWKNNVASLAVGWKF